MYLSRLRLRNNRTAISWAANPYRIHQRLQMACEGDPRLLFRVEEQDKEVSILVQSHVEPDWEKAFADLQVLEGPVECKVFELHLFQGRAYRFRLLANPTVKKTVEKEGEEQRKTRLGILGEAEQLAWLERKLTEAGADLLEGRVVRHWMQVSYKRGQHGEQEGKQTHLAVWFEGTLHIRDPIRSKQAVESGIGPSKGYGFGLLSLGSV